MRRAIIEEVTVANYFFIISADSIHDMSHVDHLTRNFRYVVPDGTPVKRFLLSLGNMGHKSEDMEDAVFSVMNENDVNRKVEDKAITMHLAWLQCTEVYRLDWRTENLWYCKCHTQYSL
jgi:hypothetical protein